MPRRAQLLLALVVTLACGGERGGEGEASAPADTTAPVLVPIHGLVLHAGPADSTAAAFEVAAGNPLRLRESRGGWLRLATWDDREAWAPETALVELPLWAHYQQALGGAPLSDVRPAYPLGGGRWGVEAPPPSPGVVTSGSLWIVGGEPVPANLSGVENVPNACSGAAVRVGVLAEAPAAGAAGRGPALEAALLATTAAPGPALRPLPVREAEPDSAAVAAVQRLADSLGLAPTAWAALGDEARWVALAGAAKGDGTARHAAAVLAAGEVRLVVESHDAARAPTPVLALSTAGGARPTILLVARAAGTGGERLEAYVARERDYRRFYVGYGWGC